jgi:hypothetical protein
MDIVADLTAAPPSVTLADPDDLGSFKVLALAPQAHPGSLAQALAGIGTIAEDGEAFIAVDAVKRLAGERASDPGWLSGFEKMLAYASSKGWMDPSETAIQAHVEWATS